MGFDAAATSPLDYTFRPHLDLDGTIPDPSEAQVRAFNAAIDRIRAETRQAVEALGDDDDEAARTRAEDIERQLHERQLDAVAELCAGSPAREDLARLPFRVQVAFIDWLLTELRNPTRLPATRPPLAAVR